MKKLLLIVLAASVLALPGSADEPIRKLIELKYADAHQIRPLLDGFSARVNAGSSNRVLTIIGSKEVVAEIEEMIKKLDTPVPDIELTVYMLVASAQPDASGALPPELDPVMKQLKGVFSYRTYRLLDSLILRAREGHDANSDGFLSPLAPNLPGGAQTTYVFSFKSSAISGGEKNRTVRLDDVRLRLKVPHASSGGISYSESSIRTDLDVREGQKVVVGKSSLVDGSDGALILVLSAKIVE